MIERPSSKGAPRRVDALIRPVVVPVATVIALVLAMTWMPEATLATPGGAARVVEPMSLAAGTWSATEVQQAGCPCTIWSASTMPPIQAFADPQPVEVGVKVRSSVPGQVSAIRFYKGIQNVGTHTGSLWSANGQRLASAEFVGETASGWQEVRLATPIDIAANTTYIASYHTDAGFYAVTRPYFTAPVTRGPLTALSDVEGGNGVFRYGASAFPDMSFQASNYWVDIVFGTSVDVVPPAIGNVQVTDVNDSGATIRWRTDEPADSQVEYGPTSNYGSMSVLDPNAVIDHAVRISGLAPNAGYHARIRSRDLAGNGAISPDFTFTTTSPPPPPPPAQACFPRPKVATNVVRDGPGRLRVTVTAQTSPATPTNRLAGIRFRPGVNALVDIGSQVGRTGEFTVALTDHPQQLVFYVRPATAGLATTLQLVVIDDCGEFPTLVGAGASAL